jgi:hypothetical protein
MNRPLYQPGSLDEGTGEATELLVPTDEGGLTPAEGFQGVVFRDHHSYSSPRNGGLAFGEKLTADELTGTTWVDPDNNNVWVEFNKDSKTRWIVQTRHAVNPTPPKLER